MPATHVLYDATTDAAALRASVEMRSDLPNTVLSRTALLMVSCAPRFRREHNALLSRTALLTSVTW